MSLGKKFIKGIINAVYSALVKVDGSKIVILDDTPFSGSNSHAFYNYLTEVKDYKDVEIIPMINIKDALKGGKRLDGIREYLGNLKNIFSAGVVITDHSLPNSSKKQKIVQLWHGIPLKSMGLMDKSEEYDVNSNFMKDVELFTVTSAFSMVLLNSCMGIDVKKYKVLGNPRNDLLYCGNKEILKKLSVSDISCKKLIMYMPTYKKSYIDGREDGADKEKNIFSFESFDMPKFDKYLKDNDLIFLVKLHPYEEKYYKEKLKSLNLKNLIILETDYLKREQNDIYEFLAVSDLLITDYSSVYLDYLLTMKPVLFNNGDIETYRDTRGILLEPYDFWTPGPKVNSQVGLQEEIIKLLNREDYYLEERKNLLDIFHKYQDNKSCERIWDFICENYF